MEKHTLDYYIPEKFLSCQCLYIMFGSIEGDSHYSGITHLLEHLLVAFDKERNEAERHRYIIQARTTFWYMSFTIYYNRYIVSDKEVYDKLHDIKKARTIQMEQFETCKKDVIQEIERYRYEKEKIYVDIGDSLYVDRLPIGKKESVFAILPSDIEELIRQKYLHVQTHFVHITMGKTCYIMRKNQTIRTYSTCYGRALRMIFQEIIFFACVYGMNLSLNEFHMTMPDQRLYVALVNNKLISVRQKLENEQLFKKSLKMVCKRYAEAQEFGLEQQIQIVGECLCAQEQILRLRDLKHIMRRRSRRWIYNKYKEYLKSIVFVQLDKKEKLYDKEKKT